MKTLGVSIVDAVMTNRFLTRATPVIRKYKRTADRWFYCVSLSLCCAILVHIWDNFNGVAGIKLPGLEFKNQRVEAAFRKELVLGEDDESRAEPLHFESYLVMCGKIIFNIYLHYVLQFVQKFLLSA